MTYKILHGNNLDILPTLADNSIDSIVTDPPYELGFMGKKWDSSGIAYSVELWQQCLRVLKPGGHLLSFGGTRTYHRVAVAIEDAGFELRDSIAWLYGSGFPKSLDVSKAIDKKRNDSDDIVAVAKKMKEALAKSGKSKSELDEIFDTKNVAQYWFSPERNTQIVPANRWPVVKSWLGVDDSLDAEVWRLNGLKGQPGEAWSEREVIGSKVVNGPEGSAGGFANGIASITQTQPTFQREINITAPSTPEAQQWQGWGTALKPAFEPVIVARKPIEGTVANNVIKWGTGGLNIDGSRIGTETISTHNAPKGSFAGGEPDRGSDTSSYKEHTGRWPANIILDPYTAELLDEQSGTSKSPSTYKRNADGFGQTSYGLGEAAGKESLNYGDSGGASRFFYVAKASKRDRNEGLEELEEQRHSDRELTDGVGGDNPRNRTNQAKQNFHPTVKPTSLMEYLIKLITPPNGTVLDPFTGSGSTGKAAILQGFNFIGIEMTEEYLPIIEGRLKHAEAIVAERIKETSDKQSEVLF
jgi:DNA modification methylase